MSGPNLNVVIVQPLLPRYTIDLFERIADLPNVTLTVLADLETSNQLNQFDPLRDRVRAIHLARRHLGGIVLRPGLLRFLIHMKPDIVILSGDPREWSQAVALLWCRINRIPVGIWSMFHRIGHKRLVSELYMRYVGLCADLLLSYGERGKREQIQRGVREDKLVVLSTAIDEHKIIAVRDSIGDNDSREFISESELQDKKILLHVVRLTAIKRPDIMLRCFAKLAEKRDDVVLIWIGGGPLEEETKKQASLLGIANRMRFLGPIYEERKLGLWYKSAHVFVMATCVGLSIHHAMCYGLPVVTDDNELTQTSEFEVLIDGVNGLVYRSEDCEDFAEKVSRILDDVELRNELSANAMRRIENEYTLDNKVQNFAFAIRRLAGRQNDQEEFA